MKMENRKKRNGFVLRRIAGEAVIVGESLELIDFDSIVSLNASAAYVWEALADAPFDEGTVARLLTARYDVDADTARADARELLDSWLEAGIIENE